ncbi:hypothetical protein ABIA24_001780 [Sinorhizobium fredii]|uniref:helix-turn-helix domain-containing protein n=1 Tax=Rhizobium fredii TaxID=380 RepID=UPI0035197224
MTDVHLPAPEREVSGIRALLDDNPIMGESRAGARRFWTGREEKLLREHYPQGGVSLCLQHLPGRSASSIYNRAGQLGLRKQDERGRITERQAWTSNDRIDAVILRTFQGNPDKGAVKRCAAAVNRPRWWVSKRAQQLGLVSPRFKEPEWSEAEREIIAEFAHRPVKTLRQMLASKGFRRSETAIIVKLKRLGADRTDPHNLNANQLATVMGVDRKTVASWIAKGWLKATRRQQSESDDFWKIHRRDIRRFIVDTIAAVDIRKVDKFWLVDLLTDREAA